MSRFLGIYMTVQPTPSEQALFRDAVAISRTLGVTFQPAQVKTYWWRRGDPTLLGFTEPSGFTEPTTPVCVWVAVGMDAEQIVRTVGHELLHAHEYLLGLDLLDPYGPNGERPQPELRADAFAERVVRRWQAQQRPRPGLLLR